MVILGKRDKQRPQKPLHNFDTPPSGLQWGNQHLLRCSKTDPSATGDPTFSPAVGEKLTIDLREETDRMKPAILREGSSAVERPWNLRDRKNNLSSARTEFRKEFSVSLSMEEIMEDFAEMVGHRPPRRPKKRAKAVQKELDELIPGLWLPEVTPDLYKVVDVAKTGKK